MARNRSPRLEIVVQASARQPLGMSRTHFLRDYWQKRPLLIRGAFPDFEPPLSPDDLAGLACMDGVLARIVARFTTASSFRGRARRGTRLRRQDARANIGEADGAKGEPQDAVSQSIANPISARDQFRADSGSRLRRVRNDDVWEVRTGPFDDATFAGLPESFWTLLVQDVDKWDAGTAALLEHFDFIPSWRIDDVMISYAVDQGGVGAHVDQYDVFLVQGLGQRRWAIDASLNPPTDFRDDVELKLLEKFSPTHAWVLEPGDMLYLPPGVPHDGVAVGECMTYSVGMRAPSAAEMLVDFAHAVAGQLPDERRYSDPDLRAVGGSGEIDDAAIRRVAHALPWMNFTDGEKPGRAGRVAGLAGELPASMLRTWFGCFITRYRAAQVPTPRKRAIDRAALAQRLPGTTLERDPWSRFAWCRNGHDATLFAAGQAFDAPLAWARTLAGHAQQLDGSRLATLPQRGRGIALLAALIDAGHLRLRGH